MTINRMLSDVRNRWMAKWFVCRLTSGRKSAQYGVRFSYPLYIPFIALGIFLENPYLLSLAAIIAFLGIILPMHPFDYIYNYGVAKLIKTPQIPGRGSELQMNSIMSLVFTLSVATLIISGVQLNYTVMALIYVSISSFFIAIQLFTDDFSIYSLFKKGK